MTLRLNASNVAVSIAAVLIFAAPQLALGAVRVCKPSISSSIFTETSEKAGKTRALAEWRAKAGVFGERYTSWRLAANKQLVCTLLDSGQNACLARGAPCTISQVPPLKRLGPKPTPG